VKSSDQVRSVAGSPELPTLALCVDRDRNRLWVIGQDWIRTFDGENWSKIDASFDDPEFKRKTRTTAVAGPDGELYFGSFTGLFCYRPDVGIKRIDGTLEARKKWSSDQPLQLEMPDRSEKLVEVSFLPLKNVKRELLGAVIALRDVTDKTRLQKELANSQKLASLGTLAGGIAHDFNNLLSVIVSKASILSDELSGPLCQEAISRVDNAVMQARKLTGRFLTFSRENALLLETVQVVNLIRDASSMVTAESNIRCDLDIADDLFPVDVDAGQFNQVLNNLLSNARQSMPSGGQIRIGATNRVEPRTQDRLVDIEIQDTGDGISPERLDRVFEPYFTTKKYGSGIGLATAYSILQQHNGRLTARSELGVGSSFNRH